MIILRNKQFSNKEKLNRLGKKTDKDIRKAVEGTKAEKEVNWILNKSEEEMKEAAKYYSKQDREVVPPDIAEKAKKEGVVQKRKDGKWGIVSFKTNPPTWWSSSYDSKADAEAALRGYWASKH